MNSESQRQAELRQSLERELAQIAEATLRVNRKPQDITLVAVSKTHSADTIRLAIAAAVSELGENRVQEAESKILELGRNAARWHLIGHLQTNKARRAVRLFDVIHSIDSVALARRLDRLCAEEDRAELPVLIQVDLAGEETKSGAAESELPELAKVLHQCAHLRLRGLMAVPP